MRNFTNFMKPHNRVISSESPLKHAAAKNLSGIFSKFFKQSWKAVCLALVLTISIATKSQAVTVTLALNTAAASNICQNKAKALIYSFSLASNNTGGAATLTGVTFSTTNAAGDITKYQLWYNTTNTFSSATQLGSDITTSLGTGSHTFTMSQSLAKNATAYFWITVDASASATGGNTIQVGAMASTDIVTSQTEAGSAAAGSTHTFRANPTITASATPNPVCAGGTLNFTSTPSGGSGTYTTYAWTGPTSYTAATQNPNRSSVTTAHTGVYSVTVTDNNGCISAFGTTSSVVVTSTAPTAVSASATPNPICAGSTLTLTGSGTGATSWSWIGPNSFAAATQNTTRPSMATSDAGVYTLSATNVCGTTTVAATSVAVTATAPTAVSATATPDPICAGATLNLNGSGTGATSWVWSGPSSFAAATQNTTRPSVTTGHAGIYTLTATNVCGSTQATTSSVVVTSAAPSSVTASASPNPVCAGSTLNLTGNGTGATSWSWTGPNSFAATTQNTTRASMAASDAGVYTLSATNVCGTTTATATSVSVTATAPTSVSASASPNPICAGSTLNLTGSGTGATSWSWTGPGSYSAATQNATRPSVTTGHAGIYTLSATNACGTTTVTTSSVTVTSGVPTGVSSTATPSAICAGGTLNLAGFASNATSYSWTGPNSFSVALQNTTRTSMAAADAGTYTFSATNVCGTTSVTPSPITVNTAAPTSVSATATPDELCSGGIVIFNGFGTNANSWSWSGPTSYSSTNQNTGRSVTVSDAGVYTLSATNACGTTTATVAVTVRPAAPTSVSASASPNPICAGATLNLTGSATDASSWSWEGPNGFSSTAQSPSRSGMATADAGIYTLSVTNACGTTTVATAAVTVNTTPTSVSANASPTTLCAGDNLTLTSSATGATSFSWAGNGGYSASEQNPTAFAASVSNAGIFTVTATNSCGSATATTAAVTVNANPTVSAGATPDPICSGNTLSLSATPGGGTAPYTYSWSGPSGFTSTVQNPTGPGITTAHAGIYSITVTDANGCSGTATTSSVTVNTSPTLSTNATPNPICAGTTLNLSATPGGGTSPYTYSWSGPSGFSSTAQNPTRASVTVSHAGIYSVIVTDDNGCMASATTASVSVTSGLTITAGATPNPICTGNTLSLSASPSGGVAPYTYSWSGPSSFSSTAQNPTQSGITTAYAGIYTVSVTDDNGCAGTATTASVSVNVTPSLSASATPNPICTGDMLNLFSTPTGGATPYTYSWSGPNSFTRTIQNPARLDMASSDAGVYSVTVTSANGCSATAATSSVSVLAAPAAGASASPNPLCAGGTVSLTATASGGATPYSYSWSGPALYTSTVQNPVLSSVTGSESGDYTVTVTDNNGCMGVAIANLTVSPTPMPVAGASPNPICAGETLGFDVTPGGGVGPFTFTWTGPNSYSSTEQFASRTNMATADAGVYTVVVTGDNGCVGMDVTSAVTVNAAPSVSTGATPNPICVGNTLNLSATPGGGASPYTYSWSGPSSFSSTVQNPTRASVTTSHAGVYTVAVTDDNGCVGTGTTSSVAVNTNPTVSAGATPNPICAGNTLNLSATPSGGTSPYTYSWSGPSSFSSTAQNPSRSSVTTGHAGVYSVAVTDNVGCTGSATASSVTVNSAPSVSAGATPNPLCAGSNLNLSATPSGGTSPYTYSWSGPSSFSSTVQNPTHSSVTTSHAGVYSVTVTDDNGCTANGTTSSVTVNSNPTVSAGATPNPLCVGATLNLSAIPSGGATPYTYSWSGPNSFSSTNQNPARASMAVPDGGVYSVTVTDANGCSGTGTTSSVAVTNDLAVTAGATPNPICAGNTLNLTATPSGGASPYTYSWSGPSSFSSTTQNPSRSSIATGHAGVYSVTVTDNAGCSVSNTTSSVTVNNTPSPVASATPNPVCEGNTLNLSVTPGGGTSPFSYSWSGPLSFTSTEQNPTRTSITTAHAGVHTVIVTDDNGCTGMATTAVTVNAAPSASAGATPNPLCAGNTLSLSSTPSGGSSPYTYAWSGPSSFASTVQNPTRSSVTTSHSGVYSVTVTDANGCTATATTSSVTVNPSFSLGASATPNPICVGNTLNFTSSPSGGVTPYTYSWSGPASFSSTVQNPSQPSVTTGMSGIYTVTVADDGGCISSATVVVTVNATPTISANATPNPVCEGTTLNLTSTPAGGSTPYTYLWNGPASFTSTVEDPSAGAATLGMAGVYSVTVTDDNGCTASATTSSVTVNALPASLTVSDGGAFCVNTTITASNGGDGTIYYQGTTSNGTSTATPSTSQLITSSGTYYFRARSAAGCWGVQASVTVTINSNPAAITGASSVCEGSTITLADATGGGDWSSSNASVADVDASGVVTGVSAGVATISYALPTGCFAIKTITINPVPSAITGVISTCTTREMTLGSTPSGGVWTSSNTSIATIDASTGELTTHAAGSATITYAFGSCYTTTTVNNLVAAISGNTGTCVASTTMLTDATSGGTWSSSDTSIATVNDSTGLVTGIAIGNATITYMLGSGCYRIQPMVVSTTPAPIVGPSTLCIGETTTLTDPTPGGSWSSFATGIVSGPGAMGIITGTSAGSVTITYALSPTCRAFHNVTVNPLPAVTTGIKTVCQGKTTTLSNPTAGGTWSSVSTSVATIDGSGVVTGASGGTSVISYTLSTGCARTVEVTVNPTPAAITGTTSACIGSTGTLASATTPGVSWASSNNTIATINSGTGIWNAVGAGSATITYTVGSGCSTTTTITVNPQPATITGSTPVCVGASATLATTPSGGTWSSTAPAVATIGSSTGIATGVSAGTARVTYMLGTGCYKTAIVTVNVSPAAISGPTSFCVGSTGVLSTTPTGGAWASGDTTVAKINIASGIVTAMGAGVANITYTKNGCSVTTSVSVETAPTAVTVTSGSATCSGVLISATGGTGGTIYYQGTTSGGTSTATPSASQFISATGVYYFRARSAGGCWGTQGSISVTMPTPPAAITGTTTACEGMATNLTTTTGGGTWSSSDVLVATIGSSSGVVTGVLAGTSTITYQVASGCYVTTVVTITAGAAPISGSSTICVGSSTTLTDATPGGTWSASASSAISGPGSTGVVTGVSAGTGRITYTAPGGCKAYLTVTVTSGPTAILGTLKACVGSGTTLSNSVSGGTWSSSNANVTIGSASGIVTAVTAGTSRITYAIGAGCYTTAIYTVNAAPGTTTGTMVMCAGATTTLSNATPVIVSWASSNTGVATVNTSTGVVTGVSGGTANITYTIGTGCYTTSTVTVNALPAAITGTLKACVTATTLLSNADAGGTWVSSNAGVATIGSSSGLVTGVAGGTSTITYTLPTGCRKTAIVTVNALPAAIGGTATTCVGTTTTLTNSVGGTWVSGTLSVATIGTNNAIGAVTGASSGTSTITFTAAATGCTTTRDVTVVAVPSIVGSNTVCSGSSTSLSATTPGGTWSSSNSAMAAVGSLTGVMTGATAGNATIYYRITASCQATMMVTVRPLPGVITGTMTVCNNGVTTTLYSGTGGGIWSSSNTTVATVGSSVSTGTGVVTGLVAGTTTISYTLPTGCARTAIVTVNPCTRAANTTGVDVVSVSSLSVYPNPTSGAFTVSTAEAGTLLVYAVDGKEVAKYQLTEGDTQLSLPQGTAAGIYMCRYVGNNGSTVMIRLVYSQN